MKYLSILRYVLLIVSALTVLLFFVGATDVDLMLRWLYILLGVAVVTAVGLPLINIVENPKGAVRSLIGLAIVAVVIGVSYAMASDAPIYQITGEPYSSAELKLSDTGIFAMYVAMVVAISAIVVGEISNMFK